MRLTIFLATVMEVIQHRLQMQEVFSVGGEVLHMLLVLDAIQQVISSTRTFQSLLDKIHNHSKEFNLTIHIQKKMDKECPLSRLWHENTDRWITHRALPYMSIYECIYICIHIQYICGYMYTYMCIISCIDIGDGKQNGSIIKQKEEEWLVWPGNYKKSLMLKIVLMCFFLSFEF